MSNLQEAFREAARREFAMVPEEMELDYVFSRKFERKMRRIIHAQVHGYWMMVNTAAKRVAVAVAIIVMLLTSVMAIKPIRERVIQFFIDVYENYFEIHFGHEDKNDIDPTALPMEPFEITYLPEGYTESSHLELDSLCRTEWMNKTGVVVTLRQEPGTQEIVLDNTGTQLKDITIGAKQIKYQKEKNTQLYIWEQQGYTFYLTIHGSESTKEIYHIIDSISPKNP